MTRIRCATRARQKLSGRQREPTALHLSYAAPLGGTIRVPRRRSSRKQTARTRTQVRHAVQTDASCHRQAPAPERTTPPSTGSAPPAVGYREVGRAEAAAANLAWWDADADDYQAEHGEFLGDADFVWCPEGVTGSRRAAARRRPRASACSRSAAARPPARAGWRPTGAHAVGYRPVGRACCATRRGGNERTGPAVPLVQANAERLPFAAGSFDVGLLGVRRGARSWPRWTRSSRGGPGAAAGRAVGVLGDPPDAVDLPRRPGRARPARHPALLRPHALRRGRRRRHAPPTSSSTARSATTCARIAGAGLHAGRTSSSRSGRPELTAEWGQWSPLRGELFPGTAIFQCRLPG